MIAAPARPAIFHLASAVLRGWAEAEGCIFYKDPALTLARAA